MSSKLSTLLRNRTVMRTTFDNLSIEELFKLKNKENSELSDAVNHYIKENSLLIYEGSITMFKTSYRHSYAEEYSNPSEERRGIAKTNNISNYLVFVLPNGYTEYTPIYIISPDIESFKRFEIDTDFDVKKKENNTILYKTVSHIDPSSKYPNLKLSLTDKFFIFDFNKNEILNIYFTIRGSDGLKMFTFLDQNIRLEDLDYLYSS